MASVAMSGTLKEQMLENYRKQVKAAYENKTGVAKVVDEIRNQMENKVPMVEKFTQLKDTADSLLDDFKKQTLELVGDHGSTDFWRASMFDNSFSSRPNILSLSPTRNLHCVINPNRDIEENLSYIFKWNPMYELDEYYVHRGKSNTEPASDNYVSGDLYFTYEFSTPLLLPLKLTGQSSTYKAKNRDYAPTVDVGLVISDPEMYNVLKQVSENDIKIADAVTKMSDCLDQFTTLKKFLDEFSGGISIVPEEYKQRLARKAQPRSKPIQVKPESVIPDDIKNQMKEVVFESSLLGGNND